MATLPEVHFTHRVCWLRPAVLGAHARDELGISSMLGAQPVQAAFASAGSFAIGALLPLLPVFFVPPAALTWVVSGSAILFLALLGAVAAHAGGSSIGRSVARVTFWGVLAMSLTAAVGALFGTILREGTPGCETGMT